MNTPALCAKVLNNLIASVRRDPTAPPAIPRDGIMATRAAGMRFNALKHISRAKNSAEAAEGSRLLGEALAAERSAARGDEKLLARCQRRAHRLELLRARGMLSPGDIACYRKALGDGDAACHNACHTTDENGSRRRAAASCAEASVTGTPGHKQEGGAQSAADGGIHSAAVGVAVRDSDGHRRG